LDFLYACFLGIVQGITEFLPVSSDGHLVIAQGYLTRDLFSFMGYLVGKEIPNSSIPARNWFWLILIASIPTGIIGLALEEIVEPLFSSPSFAAICIVLNGIFLLLTLYAPRPNRGAHDLGLWDAILIGIMQGFAVLPGISRSSNTIATAMFLRVRGDVAAQFSFLLSIPAVAGAVLMKARDLPGTSLGELTPYGVGAAAALVSGLWAIAFLLRVIVKGKFQYFGYYCLGFGGAILILRLWGF
jgi:undecaprenyl-diphosphatase